MTGFLGELQSGFVLKFYLLCEMREEESILNALWIYHAHENPINNFIFYLFLNFDHVSYKFLHAHNRLHLCVIVVFCSDSSYGLNWNYRIGVMGDSLYSCYPPTEYLAIFVFKDWLKSKLNLLIFSFFIWLVKFGSRSLN